MLKLSIVPQILKFNLVLQNEVMQEQNVDVTREF